MTDPNLQNQRLLAAAIDVGIAIALGFTLTVIHWALGWIFGLTSPTSRFGGVVLDASFLAGALIQLAYVLGRDLLGGGRSLGKKATDIHIVAAEGGTVTPMQLIKRNAIFAIGPFGVVAYAFFSLLLVGFGCLRDVAGCLLTPLIVLGILASIAAIAYEAIRITQAEGVRYGDQLAGTRVIR